MDFSASSEIEAIYRQYRGGLFSLALSIVGCHQVAEDAIHEAFVAICRGAPVADDLVAYVFTAVRNSAIDQTRRAARRNRNTHSLFNGVYAEDRQFEPGTDFIAIGREEEQQLRKLVDSLPGEQKQVVVLKIFAGLTFEQVGTVMRIPSKTAASRYRRVMKQLEGSLEEKE